MVMENISKVYFVKVQNLEAMPSVIERLRRLLEKSGILGFLRPQETAAIKLHFGEEGNTGFVKPEYVHLICDAIRKNGADCFISDTNTLYQGRRTNSKDHLALAYEHGFTQEKAGARVVIPDDTRKENVVSIRIDRSFIKTAKIAKVFSDADAIIGVAHFKGHLLTGVGGALKNLGMGCATREGKLAQHSDLSPLVSSERCVGCGECQKVCLTKAIIVADKKAVIDRKKCVGCASCIAACGYNAIEVDWASGGRSAQEKIAEYAYAVLKEKRGKAAFLNFAIKITQECDCLAKDDPRIAPDIGIFASIDPVSIDKACIDVTNKVCGKDIFKEVHPKIEPMRQFRHAVELGLGRLEYQLIEVASL